MSAHAVPSRDVVLAVGVNSLPAMPGMPARTFAQADARALAAMFAGLGVAEHRIQTLVGAEATRAAIIRRIARIPARFPGLTARDRVWFCFSGHGVTGADGRTHLLVHDTEGEPSRTPERSVTVQEIADLLPETGPDRILLLDACRNEVRAQAEPDHERPGLAVVSACGSGGFSREDTRRGLGVFTGALIDILSAPGRPVTVEQLEVRLRAAVPAAPSVRVEPSWQAAAMLLLPHLLEGSDIKSLRNLARSVTAARAAALWRTLFLLNPEDTDARVLHAHFEAVAEAGPAPVRAGSADQQAAIGW